MAGVEGLALVDHAGGLDVNEQAEGCWNIPTTNGRHIHE